MLAGPMDYTPGGFDNVTREDFEPRTTAPMVMSTRAHQTALFVVFESELQMVADSPDAYDGQKELEFLKAVPASWDETRVLNGVPPKYITIARRSGNEWFVGSITDWDARELDVPLSFLGSGDLRCGDLLRRTQRGDAAEGFGCREAPRECPDGVEVEAGAGRRQRHPARPGSLTRRMKAS